MQSYVLPNGLSIKHSNSFETAHIYEDVFQKKLYLKHGVVLPDHAVVVDAGANIGLFTLFVVENCPNARVFAVEPAPKTFQVLNANTAPYPQVKVFNCGLGSEAKRLMFTYFPNLTCGSGYYTDDDLRKIRKVRRSVMLSNPEKAKAFEGPIGEELLDYLIDKDLKRETVESPVYPLSQLIDENQIDRIDFLKVDVEGSEREVLKGIRDDQWPMIQQMVLEVHDSKNSLAELTRTLEERGFSVTDEPEDILKLGGKTMVYAHRKASGRA